MATLPCRARGRRSRSINAEALGDRGWSNLLDLAEMPHGRHVDAHLAACVDAARFGSCNAFYLALAAQVGLELSEHAQYVEERLAGGGAGVDRLRLLDGLAAAMVCATGATRRAGDGKGEAE